MFTFTETENSLRMIGQQIRRMRKVRGDTQKVFAYRIGVSVPTLHAMEMGSPVVSVGAFLNAVVALQRLDQLEQVLRDDS